MGKERPRTKSIMMGRLLLLRLIVPGAPTEMPTKTPETSAKTAKHGMLPWHRQSLKQLQGRWQRLICTTRLFSMREVQPSFKPALKYLQEQMALSLWTPLIRQRTNLSTRDGNCGQKRLNLPLMPWRETQKTKISYFHHWINGEGTGHIESWKNSKTLISQSAYDELENTESKYSS